MADFYQTGVVTTLHRLTPNSIERLEADLEKFSRNKPIGLVLPALYSEFETLAMQRIVPELRKVRYLQRIVVVLAKATQDAVRPGTRLLPGLLHAGHGHLGGQRQNSSALPDARRAGTVGGRGRQGPLLLAGVRIPPGDARLRHDRAA